MRSSNCFCFWLFLNSGQEFLWISLSLFNTKLKYIYKHTPELGLAKQNNNTVAVDIIYDLLWSDYKSLSSQEILCEHPHLATFSKVFFHHLLPKRRISRLIAIYRHVKIYFILGLSLFQAKYS